MARHPVSAVYPGVLLELDRLVRADVFARAALGAVIRTGEDGDVLEVECARGALVNADAAGGAQVGIDDRLTHYGGPFILTVVPPPKAG